jgi:hypothetical protein
LGILVGLALILAIRGSAGAASLSHPIITSWEKDFYTLQSLPELFELAIVCIPVLLARIGKASFAWPTAHKLAKEASKAKGSPTVGVTANGSLENHVSGKSVTPV